jgi:hypothetical protein
MSLTVVTTLAAALAFAAFHVPLPVRQTDRWAAQQLTGTPARGLGVAYHALMLPAVAALPAPAWAKAAGFAWMLADLVLEGAALAKTTVDAGPIREGVHLAACLWVLGAGWTGGPALGLAGTALAAAFVTRLVLRARGSRWPGWLLPLNALLNVVWIVSVAHALA